MSKREADEKQRKEEGEEIQLLNSTTSPTSTSSVSNPNTSTTASGYQTFLDEIDVEDGGNNNQQRNDISIFIQNTAAISPPRGTNNIDAVRNGKEERRPRRGNSNRYWRHDPLQPTHRQLQTFVSRGGAGEEQLELQATPQPIVLTYSLHVQNLCGALVFNNTYCPEMEGRITREEFSDSMKDISQVFEKHNPKPEAAFLVLLVVFFCASISAGGIIAPAWALYGAVITGVLFCLWLPFTISNGRKLRAALDERMRAQNLLYEGRGLRWQLKARASDVMPMSIEVVLDPFSQPSLDGDAVVAIPAEDLKHHKQKSSRKSKAINSNGNTAMTSFVNNQNRDQKNAQSDKFSSQQRRRTRRRAPPPPPIPIMPESVPTLSDSSSEDERPSSSDDRFIIDEDDNGYADDQTDDLITTSSDSLSELESPAASPLVASRPPASPTASLPSSSSFTLLPSTQERATSAPVDDVGSDVEGDPTTTSSTTNDESPPGVM